MRELQRINGTKLKRGQNLMRERPLSRKTEEEEEEEEVEEGEEEFC